MSIKSYCAVVDINGNKQYQVLLSRSGYLCSAGIGEQEETENSDTMFFNCIIFVDKTISPRDVWADEGFRILC